MWAHGPLADFLKILLQVHDSVRLFLLPKLISLDSIVHTKTEMQINQENISALKILNHIASSTFCLNYTNFPREEKVGELSALSLQRGSKLWTLIFFSSFAPL